MNANTTTPSVNGNSSISESSQHFVAQYLSRDDVASILSRMEMMQTESVKAFRAWLLVVVPDPNLRQTLLRRFGENGASWISFLEQVLGFQGGYKNIRNPQKLPAKIRRIAREDVAKFLRRALNIQLTSVEVFEKWLAGLVQDANLRHDIEQRFGENSGRWLTFVEQTLGHTGGYEHINVDDAESS